jgi:hypothetical protein
VSGCGMLGLPEWPACMSSGQARLDRNQAGMAQAHCSECGVPLDGAAPHGPRCSYPGKQARLMQQTEPTDL